jgi:hypothetical protein
MSTPADEHEIVTQFRKSLIQANLHWGEVHTRYPGPHGPGAGSDAHAGSLMAASYSYTLAAVLAWTERQFGAGYAAALAGVAEMILNDGDPDDLNADVMPAQSAEATP